MVCGRGLAGLREGRRPWWVQPNPLRQNTAGTSLHPRLSHHFGYADAGLQLILHNHMVKMLSSTPEEMRVRAADDADHHPVSDEFQERITSDNRMDVELYRFAVQLSEQRRSEEAVR